MDPKTDFAQLLELEKEDCKQLQFLGEAAYFWQYKGDSERAKILFEGLTELVPQNPVGHLGLAEVSLSEGAAAQAEKHARRALTAENTTPTEMGLALVLMAQAHLHRDQADKARAVLAESLELAPDGPSADEARAIMESLAPAGPEGEAK